MKQTKLWITFALLMICGALSVEAQVMKSADLEKYAKKRYGDKWLDAAKNLSASVVLDKNFMTTVPGLFAAGDCTGGTLQVAVAVGEGAIAGLAAIKYLRETREG